MSTLEQFFSKSSSLPIGSVKVVSYNNTTPTPPNTFTDSTGLWVKTGLVYSQTNYQELFTQIGKVDAADFIPVTATIPSFLAYANNTYFASASTTGSSAKLFTSPDAITWTSISNIPTTGTNRNLTGLDYGLGIYAASTDTGLDGINSDISTSPDLITWTKRYTSSILSNTKIKYFGGKFLFLNNNTFGTDIGLSTDGILWNPYSLGTTSTVYSGIYVNNSYVASVGAGVLRTSTDGQIWQTANSGTTGNITAIIHDGSKYVVSGTGGMVRTSTDLVTWTASTIGTTSNVIDMAYGTTLAGPIYAVIAGSDSIPSLRTSTDLVTWTARTPTTSSLRGIDYVNGNFIYTANNSFATSTDGTTWNLKFPGYSGVPMAGLYVNNMYVAVSNSGAIKTCTDGVSWVARTSGTTSSLSTVIFSGGLYVTGGAGGNLRSSTDAITWTARTTGTTSLINSITHDGSKYLIAGAGGMVRTSTDLITWNSVASGTASNIAGIIYGSGLYIIAGSGGMVRTSTDLITWTARTTGTTAAYTNLYYLNNTYIAFVGPTGTASVISSSTNGITWATTSGPINAKSVEYFNSKYVCITSDSSFIGRYTSTDLITWTGSSNSFASFGTPATINNGTKLTTITSNNIVGYVHLDTPDHIPFQFVGGDNLASGASASFYFTHAFYAQGKYFVTPGRGIAYTSTDFNTWDTVSMGEVLDEIQYTPLTGNYKLVYHSGVNKFVMQTPLSGLKTSTDLSTWTTVFNIRNNDPIRRSGIGTPVTQRGFLYKSSNVGLFIKSNSWGTIGASTDAVTWNILPNAYKPPLTMSDIGYDPNTATYLLVGSSGYISTSADGYTWSTYRTTGTTNTLNTVTYGNSIFAAGGNSGTIVTSTDTNTWSVKSTGVTDKILEIEYNNGIFKALTAGNAIGTSTDGNTWTFTTKILGTALAISTYNLQTSKYLVGTTGGLYYSNNTGLREYAPSYDVNTSFLVPTVTTTSVFATSASTTDTEAMNVFYIKAKL